MPIIRASDPNANGERVAMLFAKALADIDRAAEDWVIREDGEGVHVRLVASLDDDESVFFGLEEFVVTKISDLEIAIRCREYQDTILDRQSQ